LQETNTNHDTDKNLGTEIPYVIPRGIPKEDATPMSHHQASVAMQMYL
jgi:hypothetical protein